MEKNEALVVVAHPDDETIWMGGTILRNKDWKWTILSLCRANDSDRKPKFEKVCKIYGAKGLISDLDDENLHPINQKEVILKIEEKLPKKDYNVIFTHGKNGEYGHIRHIEVHNAVNNLIDSGNLSPEKVLFFNYEKGENVPFPNLIAPKPIENSDFVIRLNEKEIMMKKDLIKRVYGYPNEKGFELLSCNKIESFTKK